MKRGQRPVGGQSPHMKRGSAGNQVSVSSWNVADLRWSAATAGSLRKDGEGARSTAAMAPA